MKILFISLGCDKNLVDSEVMLGLLASRGYEMIDDEQEADIIVVNTCCFMQNRKALIIFSRWQNIRKQEN